MKKEVIKFNLYKYRNIYGVIKYAIAAESAMPVNYLEVVFSGYSFPECVQALVRHEQEEREQQEREMNKWCY